MATTIQPPKRQDRTTMALLLVAAFVAVGGIGFAVGHLTAGSSTSNNTALGAGNGRGNGGGNGGFVRPSLAPGQTFDAGQFGGGIGRNGGVGAGGSVTGTVASVNGTTMTITLANGTTVTIDLSSTTTYHNATAATSADVKTGSTVTIEIDTTALTGTTPNPSASGGLGGRTLAAKDILITTP
ncbi:MAG TPA: hypothetical protein VF344_02675 [Candidatus Limnocylindrales bacterium]